MDSESLAASRTAGQMTSVSGVTLFKPMWQTLKQEFDSAIIGFDELIRFAGFTGAGSGGLHSYRRLADGDGC